MVKSLVSKLSAASSNLSLASTLSSVGVGSGGGGGGGGSGVQETNYAKHRNDPGRFFGDGVQFKAKLIGILEVGEARGDRMCQEALQDLKMAIRAAGEHKQRITIHVTIDGLRLRDEKTGDSLYHHPVHKISFIAQDMTDSRAFGYIFGSPDSGHRFFGIKTDKAASQVVLAMRDLFQVVFELKKKEIELARQQIQSKSIHDHQLASLSSLKTAAGTSFNPRAISGSLGGSTLSILGSLGETSRGTASNRLGVNLDGKGAAKEMSPESVADLVDLEQELSSLQRGITQMERITPNEPAQPSVTGAAGKPASEDDPFGDSFTNFPTYNLLPPPESGRSRHKPTKAVDQSCAINQPVTTTTPTVNTSQNVALSSLLSPAPVLSTSPGGTLHGDDDDSWLHELDQHNDVFDTSKAGAMGMGVSLPMAPLAPSECTSTPTQQLSESNSALVDVEAAAAAAIITNAQPSNGAGASAAGNVGITSSSPIPMMGDGQSQVSANAAVKSDLDPLGTGRTRPYVDKKYFFQELKNPPKKVLNDLSGGGNGTVDITATGVHYTAASAVVDEFLSKEGLFEDTLAGGLDVQGEQMQQTQSSQQQQQQQQQQHSLPTPLNITNTTHASGIAGLQSALNTNKSKFIATNNANASSSAAATATTATLLIGVLAPQPTPSTVNICTCTISSTKYTSTAASNVVVTRLTNTNQQQQQLGTCSNNSLLTTSTYSTNNTSANSNLRLHHYQPTLMSASTSSSITTTNIPTNLHLNHYTLDSNSKSAVGVAGPAGGTEDVVMMPRDTDPFSPTRKKSDPFQEGSDVFAKLDPFEFEFNSGDDAAKQRISPTAVTGESSRAGDVFNGPLQVSLPPESNLTPTPTQPLSTAAQWRADVARLERQMSEPVATMGNGSVIPPNSTVRSRPTPSGQLSNVGQPPSAFKQQTADVISSISNKKMPHLFGQARFSKRESNSINMCRLQESDSLSENETAPEPPPRPDSVLHAEPPPLPPKKQFNEIVIRPRVTSGNAVPPSAAPMTVNSRYEFVNATANNLCAANAEVPPIPLPSRRVGRSDGIYPGPGRPRKPGHTEDDYLAPISGVSSIGSGSAGDVPPLLPPPTQTSTRTRAQRQQSLSKSQDIYENKMEILQQQHQQQLLQQRRQQTLTDAGAETNITAAPLIPDITLSQLMTLSLDDLAVKLNVPVSKLSTMTLVELTSYLSEFIEKCKPQRGASTLISEQTLTRHLSPLPTRRMEKPAVKPELSPIPAQAPVFKVNFDQQATFVAKFDDTFGEDFATHSTEEQGQDAFANFEQFNEPPAGPAPILSEAGLNAPIVPPADRYAVFREIIDKELQEQQENADLIGEEIAENEHGSVAAADVLGMAVASDDIGAHFEANFDDDDFLTGPRATIAAGTQQAQPPKIDTKITEVVAQAKDRYAALRDIILVENLFDNKPPVALQTSQEFPEFSDEFNEDQDQDLKHIMDGRASSSGPDRLGLVDSRGLPAEPSSSALTVDDDDEDDDGGGESSLDSNDKDAEVAGDEQDKYEKLSTSTQQLDGEKSEKLDMNDSLPERSASQPSPNLLNAKQDNKFLTVAGSSGLCSSKDDLEIDELMQRAISNLSLDSRERISPANSTCNMPTVIVTSGNSIALPRPNATLSTQAQFNDVSTSPIPLQKSPIPGTVQQQQKSPLSKSPQASPVLSQLSAVSNLIDTATKQMNTGSNSQPDTEVKHSKEFWATFDSPKPSIEKIDKRARGPAKSTIKTSSLHLPPPPPSNTSQNDTAESPCSSDPRDDGWSKGVGRRWPKKDRHHTSSSSRDLSPWDDELSDFQKQKRIPGVGPAIQPPSTVHVSDRHAYYMRHTRRMNSCDEDYDYEEEFNTRRDHRKLKPALSRSRDNFDLESPSWYQHAPHHTWSPQDIEHAASMRARAFERSAYERTTYGPPVYDKRGVALPPNASSSYDRRSGYDKRSKYYRDYARPNYDFDDYGDRYRDAGTFEKPKSGRRADYENIYDDGRSPLGGGGGAGVIGSYKSRASDYMYDRERKSFDRDSVESYESATRRRRSFGSGDVYGSMESHEDFRERYGPEKTRSLRKSIKLRATGDIDYEQDSESDFHRTRMGSGANIMNVTDTRSLQRPNQLNSAGGSSAMGVGQTRARKSSGSSPWDGEEPPLPGQKSWKRPSSAADSERRLAESRRVATLGLTPSGSDGEKDRRFRKKQRSRGKDSQYSNSGAPTTTGSRYGSTAPAAPHPRDNYDYITYDDDVDDDEEDYVDEDYDEPPTDEDKFERLNRRRHEMNQRMLESERRQHSMGKVPISSLKCSAPTTATKKYPTRSGEYDFDDYEQTPTPRSNASGGSSYLPPTSVGGVGSSISAGSATKFSFDGGFESDFNQSSPPPAPAGTASSCNSTPAATTASACVTPGNKSSFRFSNDFSERDKLHSGAQNTSTVASSQQQLDMASTHSPALHAIPPIITQKLRFDDNVKVSQFDDAAFEDDFSNAQFDFEKEDQWHADSLQSAGSGALMSAAAKKHNLRNSKLQQRQELIKKSESINIFGKKSEDPFEDDEFFKAPTDAKLANNNNNNNGSQLAKSGTGNGSGGGVGGGTGGFQCDDDFNFAKFDENM
ncbi:protein disabled isoform X3 [Ceratitis capitata]|uniref:protein disabled isoform X3 n=1 Tax=Ceratitis capitata TaxID=7213 RepID=UPI0006187F75|nr:protein disabled isoform X3 [Ceratitis capitata]